MDLELSVKIMALRQSIHPLSYEVSGLLRHLQREHQRILLFLVGHDFDSGDYPMDRNCLVMIVRTNPGINR